ncbi:winged helix-turn-helix domain-containing protein [Nonomuraea sp. NPDC051941]|uniref:AfsR/SARP family transcriptional regulator n=1 Tax=Nonomuraea sp. NPDC051941 TaxID=3364373 RepID=UPI0037C5DF8D
MPIGFLEVVRFSGPSCGRAALPGYRTHDCTSARLPRSLTNIMITMGRAAGEDRTAPHSRSPKTHQPDDMEFRLLGPVGLWAGDTFVGPATPQQRSVPAILLLHAGRTVPLERLLKAVREQEPPASARNAVQGHVSRLRRLLAGVPDAELSTSPPGYRLVLHPARVDLLRFRELVARAHASDHGLAYDLLRQALDLWHGPPRWPPTVACAGGWSRRTAWAGRGLLPAGPRPPPGSGPHRRVPGGRHPVRAGPRVPRRPPLDRHHAGPQPHHSRGKACARKQ